MNIWCFVNSRLLELAAIAIDREMKGKQKLCTRYTDDHREINLEIERN